MPIASSCVGLTSDSSRYWDAELYAAGGPDRLASFDKQIVRDYLETLDWNKQAPPPPLPFVGVYEVSTILPSGCWTRKPANCAN